MTLDEFIVDLKQQPWELDYVSNVLNQNRMTSQVANSFIDVFTWTESINKPIDFWRDLHYLPQNRITGTYNFITNELIAENINISDWCRQNPTYKAKQLQRTANPKENTTNHNGIYAIYITKEQT